MEVIDKNPIGEDGLIGADVFSRFLVDIDFPNSKFRLSPLPSRPDESATPVALESRSTGVRQFYDPYVAPEMKSFTPVFRFGHNLLIYTRLNDLPPKLFLIDTGAFSNTISPAAAREVTKVSSDSDLKVSDMNEMDNSVDRESPLKSKQDQILKECDRLINHFSRKGHESKRNFRSFKYASVILSAVVAILSTLQSIKHWSLLQVVIPAISSITALSTT